MLARKAGYAEYTRISTKGTEARLFHQQVLARSARLVMFAMAIIAVFMVACTALSAYKTSYGYALTQKKLHLQQLQRENDMLRVDIADLEAPERIYTLATQQLGMVMPLHTLYSPSRYEAAKGATSR